MAKIYTKIVEICNTCPAIKSYVDWDGEYTEHFCSLKSKRKDGTGGRLIVKKMCYDKSNVSIPKWCPLEDQEAG